MTRFFSLFAAASLLAGCAGGVTESGDPKVMIQIANAGAEPLQCRMIFGHWVERDLGLAEIGDGGAEDIFVTVSQQPQDGALYVMRPDGARRMMLENIFCARPNDWQATVGQIDLASVRMARPATVEVRCALPQNGGRVTCGKPAFTSVGSSTAVE
ncbi:hypothetical protein [Dongia sp.]|uniref:hypothetical protein n=1 Tax=Dongia sp. TaxID=1977262 RepID=UPI003752A526